MVATNESFLQEKNNLMVEYLLSHRRYFWSEFLPRGGSTMWATSYVARCLAEEPSNIGALAAVRKLLLPNQTRQGGWNYNHLATADADTTANCLLFLQHFDDEETRDALDAAEHYCLEHQTSSGGFSTFTEREYEFLEYAGLIAGTGWCAPNNEVTALVVQALKSDESLVPVCSALDFLARQQRADGSLDKYWWSSPEYATAESLKAFLHDQQFTRSAERALEWLRARSTNGAFNNDFTHQYSPFYSALALQGILAFNKQHHDKALDALIEKGVTLLAVRQQNDGSFGPEPLLMIPRPDITSPATISEWLIDVEYKNSVYTDHNKFFSTATVYALFTKYLEHIMVGQTRNQLQ